MANHKILEFNLAKSKLNQAEMLKLVFDRVENIVDKEEHAIYHIFSSPHNVF